MEMSRPLARAIRPDAPVVRANLDALHEETLTVIAVAMGVIAYGGFALMVSTPLRNTATDGARLASVLAGGVAMLTFYLRRRHASLAAIVCVAGTFGAVALFTRATAQPALGGLFVLPIMFSSVLLRRRLVVVIAVLAGLFVLASAGRADATAAMLLLIITLVTITSLVSARNILITLAWLSHAYQRATENERLLRDQSVEMKRVMKRLDELATRLERANQQLAFERNASEEARRLKQQFAQTISHELRTPLNLVVAFSELMAQSPELYDAPLPPRYMRDLSIVQRNAAHLQSLVNDVLDLARIEAAHMALVVERVQPEAIIGEAERTIRSLVEAQHLSLHVDIAPGLPAIMADTTRVRQVLINLLSNAVRFTQRGGVTLRAWHDAVANEIVFAVSDTGVGIPAADLGRLFQEFQQLDGSTRRKHGGTGLGLVISKRFVDMHGGRIWVESEQGVGSTFSFALPVSRAVDVPQSPFLGEVDGAQLPEAPGRRVMLLVTPSAISANLIARRIPQARVVIAPDLDRAQELARTLQPHVVVIDSEVRPFDKDMLRALMREWQLERAVFVSCPLPGEDALRQDLGIERYLVKPITRDALADALRRAAPDARHVMVVDDDHDFVQLLRRMLDSMAAGYRITYAHSGAEALAMLADARPDVLLLDLQLPDMTGADVIERMRHDPALQHVPVIVISAVDASATIVSEAPVIAVKPAPFTARDVLAWLGGAIDVADHAAVVPTL